MFSTTTGAATKGKAAARKGLRPARHNSFTAPEALEEMPLEEHDLLGGAFARRAQLSSDEDHQATEIFWTNLCRA